MEWAPEFLFLKDHKNVLGSKVVFFTISFFSLKNKVHKIIKELLEVATSEPPPKGIAHCKMVNGGNTFWNRSFISFKGVVNSIRGVKILKVLCFVVYFKIVKNMWGEFVRSLDIRLLN